MCWLAHFFLCFPVHLRFCRFPTFPVFRRILCCNQLSRWFQSLHFDCWIILTPCNICGFFVNSHSVYRSQEDTSILVLGSLLSQLHMASEVLMWHLTSHRPHLVRGILWFLTGVLLHNLAWQQHPSIVIGYHLSLYSQTAIVTRAISLLHITHTIELHFWNIYID